MKHHLALKTSEPAEICPVTGLDILRKPEWRAIQFGENYQANFTMIGRQILLSRPRGHISLSSVKASLAFIKDLVENFVPEETAFILIEDFSELDGATIEARRYFINTLKNYDRLGGLIVYGASPIFKISVKLGKRLYKGPLPIEIANDHDAALRLAQDLLEALANNSDCQSAQPQGQERNPLAVGKLDPTITQRDWTIDLDGLRVTFAAVGSNTLHSTSEGYLREEHVPYVTKLRQKVLGEVSPDGKIDYIVADVTQLAGGSRKARKHYMQSLKEWNRHQPFKMLIYVGVNRFMRAAVNLARPVMPFRVRVADDLESALALVEQDRRHPKLGPRSSTAQTVAQSNNSNHVEPYVEELLGYLGAIDWEKDGLERHHGVKSSHPFFPVYEAIQLVKGELDDLIEEKNRAEKELQRVNEELESRVRMRTADIEKANRELHSEIQERKQAVKELERAKISAEKANRAKSDFLANMSHELRTPLNHIIGFTEIVLDEHVGDLNGTQKEYLEDVTHSSQHLLSLINDILDLSKVEAGKMGLKATSIDLSRLMRDSLKMVQHKAAAHNITLTLDTSETLPEISADRRKLRQIMYNLLSNAVKFTPDGGDVTVRVRLHQDPLSRETPMVRSEPERGAAAGQDDIRFDLEDTTWVEIAVKDTGIGILPENLTRIFNAFEQVEDSISRQYQGTGLGLSLTQQLVELHGGRIWAESDGEGQGSIFRVILPINDYPPKVP